MAHDYDDAARLDALHRAFVEAGYTLSVRDLSAGGAAVYEVARTFGSLDDLWDWAEGNSDFGVIARPSGFLGER